jgi:hypothetical protein
MKILTPLIKKSAHVAFFLSLLGASSASWAVPSFARQTGQDCVSCHVGGFGPQLTPFGVRFKIGGYVLSDGKPDKVPLSAMVKGSFNQTKKALDSPAADSLKTNNNSVMDEASVFFAGRISEKIGGFAQVTYDGVAKRTAIDHVDLRFAHPTEIGGKDVVLGVSLNNNPTVQDPFNTLSVWGFPYTSSPAGFSGPETATLINGGLEHRVLGASGYAFIDDQWYAELGSYRSLSRSAQSKLGLGAVDDPGSLSSGTLYWRLAWLKSIGKQSMSAGIFGLSAAINPDRLAGGPTNRYRDAGIDAQYQLLGIKDHSFTVQASQVWERQHRDALISADAATNRVGQLHESKINVSYHFRQTWGLTAGLFKTNGDADSLIYETSPTLRPNTTGTIWQADWVPFGKRDSWRAPFANLKLGAQYLVFTKYNGASNNYDGSGRNASDNNTLYLFAWLAY